MVSVFIPAKADGLTDAEGSPIGRPAGFVSNLSECDIKQTDRYFLNGTLDSQMIVSTWKVPPSETITFPANLGGYNFTATFYDDTGAFIQADVFSSPSEPFVSTLTGRGAATVTCEISGTFPQFYFNNGGDNAYLLEILNFGHVGMNRLAGAFYGCNNLTKAMCADCEVAPVDYSAVNAFRDCTSLTSLNLPTRRKLTNLAGFAQGATALQTMFVTDFNVSEVTSFADFLQGVEINTDGPGGYDQLWIDLQKSAIADGAQESVVFHGGSATATGAGATARAYFVNTHSWAVTDGDS
jgi:hypothetical protein